MPKEFEERVVSVPWLIDKGRLHVSCPDGSLLEFPISDTASDLLADALDDRSLWKAFFNSVLASIQIEHEVENS